MAGNTSHIKFSLTSEMKGDGFAVAAKKISETGKQIDNTKRAMG